jgi:spore germination protein KA
MSIFQIFKFKKRRGRYHPRPDVRYNVRVEGKELEQIFSDCADFTSREIYVGGKKLSGVSAFWLDGVVSGDQVSEDVLRPLTDAARLSGAKSAGECMDLIVHGAIYSGSLKLCQTMDELVDRILHGFCAIVFDHAGQAIAFETKTSQIRSISEPTVEKSVKGPKDAFIETLRVNTSLVRRKLCNADLKIRQTTVGRKSLTTVDVLYINGVADGKIVDELMRRLDAIDIDGLVAAGSLEEYIVDNPRSPFPQLMHTERPDKFAMNLLEGRIGILVDGLPIGFLLPATLAQFLKVPEDNAQHFVTATTLTVIRYLALIITIVLPAFYVALAMYHQEMIPLKLLLSVIESKQQVPFSTAVEILGMLIAFELLQEAGLRLPNPVGETVSIIGALIVGQSAVEARVISPIAVIVVALAGICGYTIPNQDLGAALRISRFLMVVAALLAGMFGIMAAVTLLVYHLCTIESFHVAYMSPMSDGGTDSFTRSILRPPLWRNKYRDPALGTGDSRNQK